MRVRFSAFLLFGVIVASGRAADRVSAEQGRIVLERSSGHKSMLTDTGRDSDPWITSDGLTVIFVRRLAEESMRNSVYEIDVRTRATTLLFSGPVQYREREISTFSRPELSDSRDTLFLISKEYSTSGTLFSVRLVSGQASLISDEVVGYDVVSCPKKFRGDLIVLKRHEEDILGKPYFLYYLYSPSGLALGVAGGGELDAELDFIRGGDCEEPDRTALATTFTKPPAESASKNSVRVDASEMDRRLITRVQPIYPGKARIDHIEGDVRLELQIAEDGTVQDVVLVSGPPQLVESARVAVRQWRYRPTILSGRPVSVVTTVTIPFRLPSFDR